MAEVAKLARSSTPGPSTTGLLAASSLLAPPNAAGSAPGESSSPIADPSLRLFQAAADDESLHAAVLGSSAHLRVQTATGEDLSLHLRVRDGIADVRVDRTAEVRIPGPAGSSERAEPRAELKASEVQAALASEGLALGRFESTVPQQPVPQQPDVGDGEGSADGSARALAIPALASRGSWAASVSSPAPTIGNPRAERERPPAIHVAIAQGPGGAPGPRPAAGSTGSGRATGYDLGARRPAPDEPARVVAGLSELAGPALASGASAGANPTNLDQHPNPNPNPSSSSSPNQNPNHAGGTRTAAHSTGGAATGTYSSPHQHHQRHPHREGAAEGDGVHSQRASAPARAATTTTSGPRDPHTTATRGDGTPGVHVTA